MKPVVETPTDLQLALCALHADLTTVKLRKRLAKFLKAQLHLQARFSAEFHGVRLVLFTGEPVEREGRFFAPAVLAFRGTKLNKAKTVAADLQVLLGAKRDLFVCVTARKLVDMLVAKLERAEPNIDWHFFATGHSLGGFLSLTTMIHYPEKILQCVAFEPPGLTPWYYDMALQQGDEEWWRARVRLYVGLPNPINMCNRHLGRMFQVNLLHERKTDAGHILSCLLGTSLRSINWFLASNFAYSSVRTCVAVSAALWTCLRADSPSMSLSTLALASCTLPVGMAPVTAAAIWALQGTSAFLACRLGTTIKHILVQHSMVNMVRAFDHTTGMPYTCVEMASWPSMATVAGAVGAHLRRALIESFVPVKTAEGLVHMFDMTRILEARIQGLEGYMAVMPTLDEADLPGDPQDSRDVANGGSSTPAGGEIVAVSMLQTRRLRWWQVLQPWRRFARTPILPVNLASIAPTLLAAHGRPDAAAAPQLRWWQVLQPWRRFGRSPVSPAGPAGDAPDVPVSPNLDKKAPNPNPEEAQPPATSSHDETQAPPDLARRISGADAHDDEPPVTRGDDATQPGRSPGAQHLAAAAEMPRNAQEAGATAEPGSQPGSCEEASAVLALLDKSPRQGLSEVQSNQPVASHPQLPVLPAAELDGPSPEPVMAHTLQHAMLLTKEQQSSASIASLLEATQIAATLS